MLFWNIPHKKNGYFYRYFSNSTIVKESIERSGIIETNQSICFLNE